MIKIALVVTIVSISSPEKVPDITIPVYYNNIEQCNNQLDFLKETVNADNAATDYAYCMDEISL